MSAHFSLPIKNAGFQSFFGAATLKRRYHSYQGTLHLGLRYQTIRGVLHRKLKTFSKKSPKCLSSNLYFSKYIFLYVQVHIFLSTVFISELNYFCLYPPQSIFYYGPLTWKLRRCFSLACITLNLSNEFRGTSISYSAELSLSLSSLASLRLIQISIITSLSSLDHREASPVSRVRRFLCPTLSFLTVTVLRFIRILDEQLQRPVSLPSPIIDS